MDRMKRWVVAAAATAAVGIGAAPAGADRPDVKVPLPWWVCVAYEVPSSGPRGARAVVVADSAWAERAAADQRARAVAEQTAAYGPVAGDTPAETDYVRADRIFRATVEEFNYDKPQQVCRLKPRADASTSDR